MTIIEQQNNNIPYLAADGFLSAGGCSHGFSTRLGGVSTGIWASMNLGSTRGDLPDNVRENYRRFCAAVGADVSKIVMSNQVHGDVVRVVDERDVKRDLYDIEPYEADGLVTDVPGLTLVVFSADCLPILLYDPRRRVIAAVHAGWRGTALKIAGKAVRIMTQRYGCNPADVLAAIGPAISACCFETDGDVPEAMISAFGYSARPYIHNLPGNRYKVDLKGLNAFVMEEADVKREHIAVSDECTACLPDRYWSHRVTKGERGSQAAVIGLNP